MPERRTGPVSRHACFGGDPLGCEVGRFDEPTIVGGLEQSPQLSRDSIWIEVAAIGAVLMTGFFAGAFAFITLYQFFP